MKYYSRKITIRKPINSFGKLGYVGAVEYVKTNDIAPFNFKKKIKFEESKDAKVYLLHNKEVNKVYVVEEELTSTQAYFRRSVSKYRW